jgi:hypothetical protein
VRVFERFNSSNGVTCPICKTSKNTETVLVPIPGTEDGNIVECKQVHKKCYDLFVEMNDES